MRPAIWVEMPPCCIAPSRTADLRAARGPAERTDASGSRRPSHPDRPFLCRARVARRPVAQTWWRSAGRPATARNSMPRSAELAVTEEFHAYPGPQLLAALRDKRRATRARPRRSPAASPRALLTRSYRQNPGEWDGQEDEKRRDRGRAAAGARARGCASALFRGADRHRRARGALARARHRMAPPAPPAGRVRLRAGLRRQLRGRVLRDRAQSRPRGRDHPRRLSVPLAARCADPAHRCSKPRDRAARAPRRSALRLAQVLKRVRPELDLYLVSNGAVEEIAGEPEGRRRCAASSTRSRSCSNCISRSSRACRRASRRRSSTI